MSEQQAASEPEQVEPGAHDHAEEEHEHHEQPQDHHWLTIFINARPKEIDDRELTYNDVLMLAYDGHPPTGPNWSITITYSRGPERNTHGTLTPGHSVHVKEGMVFRVRATDRS